MKKFMCIILAAVMVLSVFTACGAPADDGVAKTICKYILGDEEA